MKVLLPINDQKFGEATVDYVIKHSWPDKTIFRILHVIEWVPSEKELLASPHLEEYLEQERKKVHKLVGNVAGKLREALRTVPVEEEIAEGRPAETILAMAHRWDADMIVLGSHARKGISLFLKGSVSTAVASHADCSITILHMSKQAQDSWSRVS